MFSGKAPGPLKKDFASVFQQQRPIADFFSEHFGSKNMMDKIIVFNWNQIEGFKSYLNIVESRHKKESENKNETAWESNIVYIERFTQKDWNKSMNVKTERERNTFIHKQHSKWIISITLELC